MEDIGFSCVCILYPLLFPITMKLLLIPLVSGLIDAVIL